MKTSPNDTKCVIWALNEFCMSLDPFMSFKLSANFSFFIQFLGFLVRLLCSLANWVYPNFQISFGVSCISKKTLSLFPQLSYHLTFAQHSLEPRYMFTHPLLPLTLLQVINLGLKVCFENGYVLWTHGERGRRDTIVFLLSRMVISKASVGYLLLEYDPFFQSGTNKY